jgi:hypothetical protein
MRRFMLLQAVNTVGFAHSLARLQAQSSRQVHWCQTALACFTDQDRISLPKARRFRGARIILAKMRSIHLERRTENVNRGIPFCADL